MHQNSYSKPSKEICLKPNYVPIKVSIHANSMLTAERENLGMAEGDFQMQISTQISLHKSSCLDSLRIIRCDIRSLYTNQQDFHKCMNRLRY